MKSMLRLQALAVLLLCAWLLPVVAVAADPAPTLDAITARLANPVVLRGQFEQSKTVVGFRNPLRSEGRFVVARDRGVIWQTDKPFASELVVTAAQIRSRQPDGSVRVEVDASQQPAMRSVNTVLFALISGDLQSLQRLFQVTPLAMDEEGWQLRLTPRSRMLARAFSSLTLHGDRHVRVVEIVEAGGDRARIQFRQLSELPAALRDDEAARFD